jgi:undecaprenyl-diphosphatase
MPLFHVVVLAVIQALTEFLPISSSGHLVVIPKLLGWDDGGLQFDIALHAGTLVAIVIYFFRDWIQIIGQGFGLNVGQDSELKRNRMLLWLLAAATVPVGIVGLLFGKQAESTWRNPFLIATNLILFGVLMAIAEKRSKGDKLVGSVGWGDGLIIGLAQALSPVPGTSRSGVTLTAGLFRNLSREAAARFSFLLATPAIAAAALKGAWDIHKAGGLAPEMKAPFLVGTVLSGALGVVVIAFFLKYVRRNSLMPFVYYRIVFGIIVVALTAFSA